MCLLHKCSVVQRKWNLKFFSGCQQHMKVQHLQHFHVSCSQRHQPGFQLLTYVTRRCSHMVLPLAPLWPSRLTGSWLPMSAHLLADAEAGVAASEADAVDGRVAGQEVSNLRALAYRARPIVWLNGNAGHAIKLAF